MLHTVRTIRALRQVAIWIDHREAILAIIALKRSSKT